MSGRPYPSYPEAERASEEYAYVDPKKADYSLGKLPREFHPLDAWNLLGTDDFNRNYYRWWYPGIGAIIGCGSVLVASWVNRQPMWGNIPRTVIFTAMGIGAGEWTFRNSRTVARKRDAVIQNYLETHYDEFAKIKRVKYGEVFLPWKCTR